MFNYNKRMDNKKREVELKKEAAERAYIQQLIDEYLEENQTHTVEESGDAYDESGRFVKSVYGGKRKTRRRRSKRISKKSKRRSVKKSKRRSVKKSKRRR